MVQTAGILALKYLSENLAAPLISPVALNQLLNSSDPPFPHLGNTHSNLVYSDSVQWFSGNSWTPVNKYMYTHTLLLLLSCFSRVRLCATPYTAAHQAPLSLGLSRQRTLEWVAIAFSNA